MPSDPTTREDQWVIVEPGVIVLPTTGYEIRRTEAGRYRPYHKGRALDEPSSVLSYAKYIVSSHMRDLLAVGIEP